VGVDHGAIELDTLVEIGLRLTVKERAAPTTSRLVRMLIELPAE
jgi:hypothetical protein